MSQTNGLTFTGQYIPGRSILHRLNAGGKLLSFLLLTVAVIAASTFRGYLLLALLAVAIVFLARLSPGQAMGAIPRLWSFLTVIFLMNAFFCKEGEPLFHWWFLRLTQEGMIQGANVALKVIYLMLFSNFLLCVTPPMEITTALAHFMRPLGRLRFPVDEIALILSAALQFIPTLLEETDTIKKAQLARGARFDSRNLLEKAESYLPLIIPIFLSAFRRADELAMAMEARGYRSGTGGQRSLGRRHRSEGQRGSKYQHGSESRWQKGQGLMLQDLAALGGCLAVCMLQFTIFK